MAKHSNKYDRYKPKRRKPYDLAIQMRDLKMKDIRTEVDEDEKQHKKNEEKSKAKTPAELEEMEKKAADRRKQMEDLARNILGKNNIMVVSNKDTKFINKKQRDAMEKKKKSEK